MKNRSSVFGGALLVMFGVLFLGIQNDWFNLNISIREIAKFWPFMIILAGIAVFFTPKRTIYNPVTALLVAFAIPLGIYNASTKAMDNFKGNFEDEFNIDIDDNDNETNGNQTKGFSQDFSVPLESATNEAKLEFGGGAASFKLSEMSDNTLFKANTKMFGSKFNLEHETIGKQQEIVFNMDSKGKSNKFHFGKGFNNEINLMLNTKPIWDLNLKLGAGDMNFDLSNYKVKNIDISTGAANVDLKVGSLNQTARINVESGVAKITIKVPKNSGCEIEMDGAMNSTDFNGFSKNDDDNWQTDNFKSASNKIYIKIESGLSSVNVERY